MPRIAYVNKMDRTGADFFNAVKMMRDRLSANAVPIQLPIGAEDSFVGMIDLVKMDARIYEDDLGTRSQETEIPEELRPLAEEYQERNSWKLWQTPMRGLWKKYLEGEEITVQELMTALRKPPLQAR